jgi:LPXTG-site transpeptidase (sortase) family protein
VQTTARDARLGAALARTLPAPTRFEAESVGISMPVRPVGVARDGQMALPPSPAVMGWYEYGPRPGETEGATVLAAHRDMPDYGTGPAARLDRLGKGDLLTVRSGSTVRRYRVTQVTRLEKEALDLETIFDRTGPPRLHVVTCGGRFDPGTRSYEDNLVVVGIPIG